MKKALLFPALLLLAGSAVSQTAPAQMPSAPVANPISSALREIFPGRQKNTIAAVDAMPASAVAAVSPETNSRRFIRISLVRTSFDPSATDPGELRGLPQFAGSAVLATSAIQLDATGRIASLKS